MRYDPSDSYDPYLEALEILTQKHQDPKQIFGFCKKVKKRAELNLIPNQNIVIFDGKSNSYKIFINDKNDLIIPKGFLTYQDEIHSICKIKNNKSINHQQNDTREINDPYNIQYEGYYDFIQNVPQNFGIIKTSNILFKGNFERGFSIGNCELEIKSLNMNILCENLWGQKHGRFNAYKLKNQLQLEKESEKEIQILGKYKDDMKHGEFTIKYSNEKFSQYYENGTRVRELVNQERQNHTTRYLAYLQKVTISNHVFQSLCEGRWLNEIIIDYYLKLVCEYLKNVNQQYKKEITLLNTLKCQDIFSSKILDQDKYNDEYFEQIIKKFNSQQKKRMIFILNVNQFHFVVLEYSNEKLMLFDSFQSEDQQKILINKVANFIKKITQNNIEKRIIQVTQQNNAYDCGIYSIYNCLQLFKLKQKNYNILSQTNPKQIKQLRFHISQVITNRHSHLLPKFY